MRGGRREGAGRKPDSSEARVTICTRIDAETARRIDELRGDKPLGQFLDDIIRDITQ